MRHLVTAGSLIPAILLGLSLAIWSPALAEPLAEGVGGPDELFSRALALQLQARDEPHPRAREQLLRQAAELYERVRRLRPDSGAILSNLAQVHAELGQFEEAEGHFAAAAASEDPRRTLYLRNFADFLAARERWREAAERYRQALELEPRDALAHRGLAEILGDRLPAGLPDYLRFLVQRGQVSWAEETALRRLRDPSAPPAQKRELLVILADALSRQRLAREVFEGSEAAAILGSLSGDERLGFGPSELLALIRGEDLSPGGYSWWARDERRRRTFRALARSLAGGARSEEQADDYLRLAVRLSEAAPDLESSVRLVGRLFEERRMDEIDALARWNEPLVEAADSLPPAELHRYELNLGLAYCEHQLFGFLEAPEACTLHMERAKQAQLAAAGGLPLDPRPFETLETVYRNTGRPDRVADTRLARAQATFRAGRPEEARKIAISIDPELLSAERRSDLEALRARIDPKPEAPRTIPYGEVRIVVRDEEGVALPGVSVELTSLSTGARRTVLTGEDGRALVRHLPPGERYAVTSSMEGFESFQQEVAIQLGASVELEATMHLADVTGSVTIVAEAPVIDILSTVTGKTVSLEDLAARPLARAMTGGEIVGVTVRQATVYGSSFLTDAIFEEPSFFGSAPLQFGRGSTRLGVDSIAELEVLTGGLSAEYGQAAGGVVNVVTRSGTNDFKGLVRLEQQSIGLTESNDHAPGWGRDWLQAGFTVGGPIVRDRAWFFVAHEHGEEEERVVGLDTNRYLRTVEEDRNAPFVKLTWSPTDSALLALEASRDSARDNGGSEREVVNSRDRRSVGRDAGLELAYSQVLASAWVLDLSLGTVDRSLSRTALDRRVRNDVFFRAADRGTFLLADEQKGGFGADSMDEESALYADGSTNWLVGDHDLKLGFQLADEESLRDLRTVGEVPAVYSSLAGRYLREGVPASALADQLWTATAFDPSAPGDVGGLIAGIDRSPNRDALYALLDLDGDGVITGAEIGRALVFDSAAGNPTGDVNYVRTLQAGTRPGRTESESLAVFLQDTYWGQRFTLNAGIRAERHEHADAGGAGLFTFDWEFAPRLAAVVRLTRNDRHLLRAGYGRFYHPPSRGLVRLSQALSGQVLEEQLFVLGEWIPYRRRGRTGPGALLAPSTRTPYSMRANLSYAADLGRNMSLEVSAVRRETRRILGEYDLRLFSRAADGTTFYPGETGAPGSLFLGPAYFDFGGPPGSDFVLATLAGAEASWSRLELAFMKRFSHPWQVLASIALTDEEANVASLSGASTDGNDLFTDPRAPNRAGQAAGSVRRKARLSGSYEFDNGISIGGVFQWSSGGLADREEIRAGRRVPIRIADAERFGFAGIDQRWIAPGSVGTVEDPGWATLDLRFQYRWTMGRVEGTVLVDALNVANDQRSARTEHAVAGSGAAAFGEGIRFIPPRRLLLGLRFEL